MRRPLLITTAVAVLVVGTWLAVRAEEARRFRGELARAREDVDAHRYATARSRLSRLASRRPADGELLLLLGECEKQLGRPDEALALWNRIPEGSEQATRAALARGRLALARGALSDRGTKPSRRRTGVRRCRRGGSKAPGSPLLDDGAAGRSSGDAPGESRA